MKITLGKIFYFMLFLACALVTAGLLLFQQIDPNDYRQHLERRLSSSLGQPVQIGHGNLTFNKGLALDLRELRIGPAAAPLVEIPRLTATLKIAPLWDHQLILDQVLIDNPRLQLRLPVASRPPPRGIAQQLFEALGITILSIRNATLEVHRQLPGGESKQLLRIDNIHAVLKGWQADTMGQLVISGQLQQKTSPADFLLDLGLPSSPDPAAWRNDPYDGQLTLKNLSTEGLPKLPGQTLPGAINLRARLKGIPAAGAELSAELRPTDDRHKFVELSGSWLSSPEQESLRQLTGSLLGLAVSGEGRLQYQPGKTIFTGRLASGQAKLNREILELGRTLGAGQLLGGELERLTLSLEKAWPTEGNSAGLPKIGLKLALNKLEWSQPELKPLEKVSVDVSLEEQRLTVGESFLVAAGLPIFVSGTIEGLPAAPQLDLAIRLAPELAGLDQHLPLPEDWTLSGPVPTLLHLQGPLQQPVFLLDADLTESQLLLGQLLRKPSWQTGSLQLQGRVDKQQLQLDRLQLRIGEFQASGCASFPWRAPGEDLLLKIDPLQLAPLQPLSPLLSRFKLEGAVGLRLEAQDQGWQGALDLRQVGGHFFNIVSDLNQANGQIQFDRQGLTFRHLAARLGESPLIAQGTLADWSEPELILDLKGGRVRAQDLIFPNLDLLFYDLDGRLHINAGGISFEPVRVRLEHATTARVSGKVENFQDPQTILHIESERADLLQVIGLFRGPRRSPPKVRKGEHRPTIISVQAAQGTLGDLSFQNAAGLITDQAGIFTLYPLNFQAVNGHCQARVEYDRNLEKGLLKISGHAENLDATILHQDLFNKRGLIKGELHSDFYLEGPPGEGNFWKTALGGIHLRVRNGTLRKFKDLAKVFSILNVSQLFAFQLPDIDQEGMPFSLLEGSIRIENGLLKTEDMRVVSEAMNLSLVGQQSLIEDQVDYHLGVMPLRTVDKLVTSIPIAGWLLAGENKAVFTAHFKIEGPSNDPKVTPIPVDSISDTVFGIVKRTFGLPGKLVKDIGTLFQPQPEKKLETGNPDAPAQ